MHIAVVSDTHIPIGLAALPQSLLRQIDGVDAILHAGDIVTQSVLDALEEIAPTVAVAGNMDPPELMSCLGNGQVLRLGGYTLGLKHGHQPHALQSHYITSSYDAPEMSLFFQLMRTQLPGAEIVVFGHFHRPLIHWWNGTLFINPGAVSPSYGRSSFAFLQLGKAARAQIIPLDVRS